MAIGNSQADAGAAGSGLKLSLIFSLEVAKDEYVLALEVLVARITTTRALLSHPFASFISAHHVS